MFKPLFPLIVLPLFMFGCATVPTSQYEQYKTFVANKNYAEAIATMESIIEDNPYKNESYIRLHAIRYSTGKYGEYNLKQFTYWINRLGDEIGDAGLEMMVKDINAADVYYQHNPNEAGRFYASCLSICDESKNLPGILSEDAENAPLYIMSALDCPLAKLDTEKGLKLYQKYLTDISKRKSSASKALGIKLYLDPDIKLEVLDEDQRVGLVNILSQIISSDVEQKKAKLPPLASKVSKKGLVIFSLSESNNDEDWLRLMGLYQEILSDPKLSSAAKDYFSEYVLKAAYLRERKNEMAVAMENILKSSTSNNLPYLKYIYFSKLSELGESKRALELFPEYFDMPITFKPGV